MMGHIAYLNGFFMSLACLNQPHANLNATLNDGILELALHRPERKNALFTDFYLAIEQALIEADQDAAVRVVIIRGQDEIGRAHV